MFEWMEGRSGVPLINPLKHMAENNERPSPGEHLETAKAYILCQYWGSPIAGIELWGCGGLS